MEIHVEMSESMFSDEAKKIEKLREKLSSDMMSAIGVSAKIVLVSPNSIARAEGKAKRITDKRKLV
jgi:phenylacetate-CoA ligase